MNDERRSVGTRPKTSAGKRDRITGPHVSRSFGLLIALLLLALVLPAGASAAECTNTWTGAAEGTWQTAGNWSAKHAPTSTDVACIGAGKTAKVTSGTGKAAVVQGEGSVVISTTLEVLSATESSKISGLTMAGGTLKGAATVKVSGSLSWTEEESTMSGTGSTVVLSGATASTPANRVNIKKRHFNNEGTLTAATGEIFLSESAEFTNSGTFNANMKGQVLVSISGKGSVVNTGTLRKTSGTGITEIASNFENKGTVEAQTGILSFSEGGSSNSSASWKSSKGAELQFAGGTYKLSGGSFSGTVTIPAVAGAATVNIESMSATLESLALPGGTLNVQSGSMTVGTMTMGAGTLGGAGTLKVSESLSWTAEGYWKGSGSTVILPGATASTAAMTGSYERIEKRHLINEGTFTAAEGELLLNEGAEIINTGTFNANHETFGVIGVYGTGGTFVNTGTFRKTSGTEASWSEINFENKGTVEAQTGILSFSEGGSSNSSGSWKSSKGAELQFAGGTYKLSGGSFSGTVTIPAVAGAATVNIESMSATLESLALPGGTLNVQSGSMTVGTMTMGAGTLGGAGTLKVSESLSWTAEGYWKGSGSTVILPGATASTAAMTGSYERIEGRHLINEGIFTAAEGELLLNEGAEISNTGTFNANEELLAVIGMYGAGGTFVNTGTYRKNSGTEASWSEINFENKGTVDAQAGTLRFSEGGSSTSSGHWEGSKGGKLEFAGGTYTFKGGSLSGAVVIPAVAGAATVNIEGVSATLKSLALPGGTLNVQSGSMTVGTMTMGAGTLGGAGTLKVSESLSWTAEGYWKGSGSTVILPGATASTAAMTGFYERIEGRHLINEGTFTAAEGEIILNENAEITNTGTFNVNEEYLESIGGYGAEGKFVNFGTTQKNAGTGTSFIGIPFENLGTLQETSGHLIILHPVMQSASFHHGNKACSGDPVECATGNFSETQTDFEIGGRGVGLDLTRTYSAQAAATAGSPGAFGYGWTNSFSDHLISEEGGKKINAVQADGGTVPFTESGKGTYAGPSWSKDTLSGTAETGYTLTLPEQTKDKFSGAGKLESVTDRNGNATTLAYNKSGQLETITDPVSRKITLTYNGEGLVESAKDPMGHEVKYTYEGKDLKTVTMPGEAEPRWQFKYDGSHRVTSMTDGRGGEMTNEYDGSSRVISQTDPAKRTMKWEYAPFHTKITNEATGAVTDEWFTSNNEPYSITHGFGTGSATTDTFTYNAVGQLLSKTDGDGHKTTYTYDAHGNRTSETNAVEDETKWTYNETHDVLTETKPNGEKTTITRDEHGNPETISRPAPGEKTQTTSYEYGSHGEVKSMTDPLKRTWTYEYDSYGDRKAETDPEGDKRTSGYSEDSLLTSVVSPRGNEEGAEAAKYTTSIERNAQGRPIKVTDPLEHTTKSVYDPNGNVESVTDPNGHKTKYTYNADNELTKVEKPNGNVLETGYDGAGQMTSQTDGDKHTTTYVRNVLEEPIEVKDPLGRVTKEEFDAAGNLKKMTDPAKRETTYAYDAANQLKEVTYSDKVTPNVKYEYDADGNVKHMTDGAGEATYTFDQLDRLTKSKDGHGDIVEYEYDLGNQQTKITYPNGKSVTRAFDNAGRLKTITDWLEHTTTFAYDRDSDFKTTTFPTGTTNVDEYAYDRADQMSEVKMKKGAETLASLGYSRDKAGQIESLTSKGLPGGGEEAFIYDENNRLTKAGAGSYEYDAANNPTKTPGSTNTYDNASQLEKGTGSTYTYDELGERTKLTPSGGPATTYKYDQAGRVTAVERSKEGETPAISESYTYDGTGLLASQTVSGSTSYLTWDTSGSLPMLFSDSHNSYIYGPGGVPVEQISSEETPAYYHHDQLGSTRMLTNSSGNSSGTFTYGAYGALTGSTGSQTTPLGYAGQYTASQSGLQYLRARFYDPATAQFMTRDPLEVITRSPYGYVSDNPLNGTDPTGLCNANPISESFWTEGNCISESSLNPLHYYEKEIEAIESGCSYWDAVSHGLEGAVVLTADAAALLGATVATPAALGTAGYWADQFATRYPGLYQLILKQAATAGTGPPVATTAASFFWHWMEQHLK